MPVTGLIPCPPTNSISTTPAFLFFSSSVSLGIAHISIHGSTYSLSRIQKRLSSSPRVVVLIFQSAIRPRIITAVLLANETCMWTVFLGIRVHVLLVRCTLK